MGDDSSFPALIGHIEIADIQEWPQIMARINEMLLDKHGIDHVTLQPEVIGEDHDPEHDRAHDEVHNEMQVATIFHEGETFYVDCSSGDEKHRMAFHVWGNPSNPVLMCVHGLTRRGSDFKTLALAMCKDYYVVCPDIVGRGDSDRLSNPMLYAVPQYVSDIATLVKNSVFHNLTGLVRLWVVSLEWFTRQCQTCQYAVC